ncbi:DNA-binding domain-containing protein [Rhizobium sp. SL86]|uniref:DNA-binding domain-containing protein n=1 Tax=Rhizobium sp. SL86 TaxID=2995148 RepID=UPI002272E472|nr:DNA-binding domain-containing protein [Rhizobium sp. SL86]MCY1667894.1 hypothetical protein [Rhizobium sp. SL86]
MIAQRAECHPEAWKALLLDYLRLEAPSFSSCYRRLLRLADINDWSPIPPERSLRRRLNQELPMVAQLQARVAGARILRRPRGERS